MKKPKPHKITREDFDSWKDNAITQAVFAHLSEVQKLAQEKWLGMLEGEVSPDPMLMQLVQVELKAKLEFIKDMQGLELSDIQEEEEDGDTGKRRS